MKKVIYIIALLFGSTTMAQTITVNGTPMLVSDDISFPFWLESGSSISPEVPVSSISVLEFNIVPNNNGNDMVFNQVISVTEGQTVPEGKTWKVESILMVNQGFELSSSNSNLFIPTNSSSINIVMEEPVYDSISPYWTISTQILPSGGSPITERGFCYSSTDSTPDIFDIIIINESELLDFDYILNNGYNLEPNTTYYVRSFATNLEGISYSNVCNFTTTSQTFPEIGQYHAGGQLFYVDGTGEHGWVCALEDSGYFGYNEANNFAETYELNGFTDWVLPSVVQLEVMYNSIGPGSDNIGGFSGNNYYSNYYSYPSTGWVVDFSDGVAAPVNNSNSAKVRVVRSF